MRLKHRRDQNHGKNGWVGGNPRYGRNRGFRKSDAPKDKVAAARTIKEGLHARSQDQTV
jgi:hypothetical protein